MLAGSLVAIGPCSEEQEELGARGVPWGRRPERCEIGHRPGAGLRGGGSAEELFPPLETCSLHSEAPQHKCPLFRHKSPWNTMEMTS